MIISLVALATSSNQRQTQRKPNANSTPPNTNPTQRHPTQTQRQPTLAARLLQVIEAATDTLQTYLTETEAKEIVLTETPCAGEFTAPRPGWSSPSR